MSRMIQSKIISGGDINERIELAEKLAKKILKTNSLSSHPDFILVTAKEYITIDQIRELQKKLSFKSYKGKERVSVIHEAEKLTLPAQNALLKTLEEPPKNTIIILTVNQKEAILPTIISRCQVIKIKSKNFFQIKDYSKIISASKGEKIKFASFYLYDKDKAKNFCQELLLFLRKQMIINPNKKNAKNVRLVQKTIFLLERNTNPILATGNMLLRLL